MTILSTVQDAMLLCGLERPSFAVANTDQTVREFVLQAQFEGDELARTVDWRGLKVVATITGDGSSTVFDLPSDFHRFMPGERFWLADSPGTSLRRVSDDEMSAIKSNVAAPIYPVWRLLGDQIEFYDAPDTGKVINTEYRTLHWIINSDLTTRYLRWNSDTDIALVPERILTLGTVYRWKRSKGFPYEAEQAEYERQKAYEVSVNSQRPTINVMGRSKLSSSGETSVSWVPSVIV